MSKPHPFNRERDADDTLLWWECAKCGPRSLVAAIQVRGLTTCLRCGRTEWKPVPFRPKKND